MAFERDRDRKDLIVRSFDAEESESPKERKGFSLIELMVVIAIIAILASIAFLSMLHYRMTIRVNASARDLAGHMRIARANAIRDGQTWTFKFIQAGTNGFYYGQDIDANGVVDGVSRTKYFASGIVYGFRAGTVSIPGHADVNSVAHPVFTTVSGGSQPLLSGQYIHFGRNGTTFESYSGINTPTDGAAYIIPSMDIGGTGARDDRQRGVDWFGNTGRIRLWYYHASSHRWK